MGAVLLLLVLFVFLPLIESQQFVGRWIHTVHVPMRCQSSGQGDNNKPVSLSLPHSLCPSECVCVVSACSSPSGLVLSSG